jgi:hypothetical protein
MTAEQKVEVLLAALKRIADYKVEDTRNPDDADTCADIALEAIKAVGA